jgi:hypothetical protein
MKKSKPKVFGVFKIKQNQNPTMLNSRHKRHRAAQVVPITTDEDDIRIMRKILDVVCVFEDGTSDEILLEITSEMLTQSGAVFNVDILTEVAMVDRAVIYAKMQYLLDIGLVMETKLHSWVLDVPRAFNAMKALFWRLNEVLV